MLLEARLVAGSKLTRDMSQPAASYREGVNFPGRQAGTHSKVASRQLRPTVLNHIYMYLIYHTL